MNKSNENFLIVQNAINMSSNEAYRALSADDETIKPYAVINIESIENQQQADIFVYHLTNHPNPVREACALCLCDLVNENNSHFFHTERNISTLSDAICDINPNICRAIIEMLKQNQSIARLLEPFNIKKIRLILDDFKIYEKEFGSFCDNKMKNKKNHAKNKKLFNLYWCLEALSETLDLQASNVDEITDIARICTDFLDYTIREKAAKILSKIPNAPAELLQKLKNDENFYVKNLVYDKISKDSNYRDTL